MNNLTTLLKRLEAATCRLEDIASAAEIPKDAARQAKAPAVSKAPSKAPSAAPKGAADALPEALEEYDAFLTTSVDKYVRLSDEVGGLVAQQAAEVLKAFNAQRTWLLIATKAARPSDAGTYESLLEPMSDAVRAASELKDANRQDPQYNHLASVADGLIMFGWITIDDRPFAYVEDALGSAQFFGNKVLKDHKNKDSKDIEWIQAFYQVLHDLGAYVKRHYHDGVPWNPEGDSAEKVARMVSSAPQGSPSASASSGAPPPPPPPPPGPAPVLELKTDSAPLSAPSSQGGFDAVFSELNRGAAVTKGLRKVEKSEMTHKNPALRATSSVPDEPAHKSQAPGKKPKPESMRMKRPGKKELEGQKWTIENFEKEPSPIEIEASLSHSVLISRCNNTTVIVKGKANQITVENSTRLSLVVDTLISTVDVVNSNNFALQVLGTVPAVMLDKIDGASVYFGKESTSTKLFTSKCSGINLNVISGPDEDYKEIPLPSQICSYFDTEKGDLVNEIVAHAG
ncbi:Adenylyl cyclase-associated protein [Escovopsis weberi]|uniref:Adenylyl cyclase-associated protein n=1 Tax=Escovopsis weberi TaxID=150374 RepID=A0A0M8N7C9_ESCWE|nr:Adenylyl cyclase-associated protein [Escovopsis weberi]